MKIPLILVNFKTYSEAVGEKAVELAKVCEKIAKAANVEIAVAVQATDLERVSQAVSIPVLAEHIDPVEPGAHTGSILAESVKENGAVGTLINHSEDRISMDDIQRTILRAKENQLTSIVCADTPEKAKGIAGFNPDFIAIEPPELIGGDISISTAKPEIITETIKDVHSINKEIPVLCGAGVKTMDDVRKSKELGAKGILVASGVTKAEDPEKVLLFFAEGLK